MGSASSTMSARPALGNGSAPPQIPAQTRSPAPRPSDISQSTTGAEMMEAVAAATRRDTAALKAQTLQSARSGRSTPVSLPDSYAGGPDVPATHGQDQKEEGEVSDEDEGGAPTHRPIPSPSKGKIPSSSKGKAKAYPNNSIDALQPAASDISAEDARRYMDTIRSLLQKGFHPDTLISRGATAKYVTAVCEDIVAGTSSARPATILQPSTSMSFEPRAGVSTLGGSSGLDKKRGRSSSSEVEVVISSSRKQARRDSLSSEGTAEIELLENYQPVSKPTSFSQPKLKPLEQWKPPFPLPVPTPPTLPPARVAPVETYKPPPVVRPLPLASSSRLPVRPATTLPIAPALALPVPPFQPTFPLHPPPGLPFRPVPTSSYVPPPPPPPPPMIREPPIGPKATRQSRRDANKRRKFKDEIVAEDQPIVLNYDEDASSEPQPVKQPSKLRNTALPLPSALPSHPELTLDPRAKTRLQTFQQPPPVVPPRVPTPIAVPAVASIKTVPTPSAHTPAADGADGSNPILDIRRKALESLLKRRKTREPSATVTPSEATTSVVGKAPEATRTPRSRSESRDSARPVQVEEDDEEMPMDVEEPEEGEIIIVRSPTPPPPPALLPVPVVAQPQPSRHGTKRPTAEDFDSKPVAVAPSRVRRKPWCVPQHRSKLVIHLDDDSESSSDEDDPSSRLPTPMGIDLVKEKEEQIRLLKEKIAARMKDKIMAKIKLKDEKKTKEDSAATAAVDGAGVTEAVADVVAKAVKAVPDDKLEAKLEEIEEDKMDLDHDDDDDDDAVKSAGSARSAHGIGTPDPGDPTESAASHTFTAYAPLMRRYPQLSTSTHASTLYPKFEHKDLEEADVKPRHVFGSVDKSLLSSIILTHRVSANPHLVICRAEAGGGVCADPTCEDFHLDKVETTHEDWEEYVAQSLAAANVRSVDKKKIRNAVKVVIGAGGGAGGGSKKTRRGKAKGAQESKVMTGRNLLASQEALEDVVAKIGMLLEDASSSSA